MNGYVFRGSNFVIYIFASLLKTNLISKEGIAPHGAILSFKSKSLFGRTVSAMEANRKS